MKPRPGLGEVAFGLLLLIGGAAGFVAPSVCPQQHRQHDFLQRQPTRFAEQKPVRCEAAAVPCRGACRMSGTGNGSQERNKDVVDSKGIDAKGGTDTKGIYGFAREIVEQEAAEAPFRRLRLIGYALPAFIAIFLAGISLGGMAGLEEFREASENLPNPLIDAGVVGVAFYLWVEEVKTKRSSLALLKKKYEEQSKVPNRSVRRQKKAFGKKKPFGKKNPAAAAAAADATDAVATKELPSSDGATETAGAEGASPPAAKKGMFEGVKETLDAVNKQSYYQALALNKELEEKGVLPPLERRKAPPGGQGGEQEGATVTGEEGSDASESATPVAAGGAESAAAVSQGGGSKRRKKGKKGKRGK